MLSGNFHTLGSVFGILQCVAGVLQVRCDVHVVFGSVLQGCCRCVARALQCEHSWCLVLGVLQRVAEVLQVRCKCVASVLQVRCKCVAGVLHVRCSVSIRGVLCWVFCSVLQRCCKCCKCVASVLQVCCKCVAVGVFVVNCVWCFVVCCRGVASVLQVRCSVSIIIRNYALL